MSDHELTVVQQNIFSVNDRVRELSNRVDDLQRMLNSLENRQARFEIRISALESATKNETEKEHQMWPDEPRPWPKIGGTVYLAHVDGTVQELFISDGVRLGAAKNYQKYGNLFTSLEAALEAQARRKKDNEPL